MTTWFQRRRAKRRLRGPIGLWYHPQYKAEALSQTARVPGVEIDRGEKILGLLAADGLIEPRQVRPARIAPLTDLAMVHSQSYLDETARPEGLARIFGLEADDVDVDPTLIAQRRQVGGTVEAARWASATQGRVAFNLGGGFHHAEPEQGSGFCVYNDVAIAIAALRRDGYVDPIAIVDLDYHQGNGNVVTYENDTSVLTYSIHGSVWTHVEAAADHQYLLPSGTKDDAYLELLGTTLPELLDAHQPHLIFYIAGTDILATDRLGDFQITRVGVLTRDRFVIDDARARGCSVVVTLAGGYSDDAWRAAADLAHWLLTDEVRVHEEPTPNLLAKYAEIRAQLDPHELQRGSGDWEITEADLLGDLGGSQFRSTRILDYYSKHGLEFALEQYGLMDEVRQRGFTEPKLTIDPNDPERQHIALHAQKDGEEHLLVDLVLGRRLREPPPGSGIEEKLELLSIEWMMLQNPTEDFSLRHPQWPGQEHPGLGVGEALMVLLLQGAQRLGLDGVVNHPSRYHIAFIGGGEFLFLDPEIQGRFEALRSALAKLDLAEAAATMERGGVRWADDETVVEWLPEEVVIPTSERLFMYLGSDRYQSPRRDARRRAEARGFSIDAAEHATPPLAPQGDP
ncbi:MAG: histone deacetylase [Polyangiales bacterium]